MLSVVIVNYKTPTLTHRCIGTIYQSNIDCKHEIIVVDNASNDNSEEIIKKSFPSILWINNPLNEGFGRANNIGAQYAKGKFLLFLNSDMLLYEETIKRCLEEISKNEGIGVLGCKLFNEDGSYQMSIYSHVGQYYNVLKNNLLFDFFIKKRNSEIEAVMGSFMLIPKHVFELSGGFDSDFFMYAEELDLCRRIKKLGYKIQFTEKTCAIHKHGGSSEGEEWSIKQSYLSDALLYHKTKGFFGYWFYHFLMIMNFLTNFFLMWRFNKNFRKDFWKIQKAYFSNFFYYLHIPFRYKRGLGDGKKMLKRA